MRWLFVLSITFAYLMIFASSGLPGAGEAAPQDPPSIVLIVVDTVRADHLGTYGYDRPTSPHLDAWAASGRVYERALAPSPWTLPSMASLLTGQLPSRHRAGQVPLVDGRKPGFVKNPRDDLRTMVDDVATLAERLKERGYRTGAVVTNSFLAEAFGVARGFDHYDQTNAFIKRSRPANKAVDASLSWLDSIGEGPFLLLVHFIDPHLAYAAPPPHRGRFTGPFKGGRYSFPFEGGKDLRFGLVALEERDREFIRAAYDEEIAWVDQEVERLRCGLESRGLLDDALVVLTSDHGEELFEHGGFEHGHAMWQELLSVPLIVWGPKVMPGRDAGLVSLIDIAPTLLEAVGDDAGQALPGISLWSNLTRELPLPARPLYAEASLYGPRHRSIVDWPDKLILVVEPGLKMLFDLSADPGERKDLAAERPERVDELMERLDSVIESNQRRAGMREDRPQVEIDAETVESLRSLGYVE